MPKICKGSPWKQFWNKWNNCSQCPLCEVRRKIVLCRGEIPCDLLFVGEAPGASEDILGRPFVGPAGKLLDDWIKEALQRKSLTDVNIAFTNLVCCIPKVDGSKIKEPPEESITACEQRLTEFIDLCKPPIVVAVGDLSERYLSNHYTLRDILLYRIVHPAKVLRAELVRKPLMIQKAIVTLEDALTELIPF